MPISHHDPALMALRVPFEKRLLDPHVSTLFLRARPGGSLLRNEWTYVQSFKPWADGLTRIGLNVHADMAAIEGRKYASVFVLPPRQREEARALLARAVAFTAPGGRVIVSMHNTEGARSGENDLSRLVQMGGSLSKHHCRVFWSAPIETVKDPALAADWIALDVPRAVKAGNAMGGQFLSRPGVFSWNRVDPASALLAMHLPTDLTGYGADLGAGYGFLSDVVLSRCPAVRRFDLFEAEARALDLARQNLERFVTRVSLGFLWHDVTLGLPERYDFVVSNPPFHSVTKDSRPDLGRQFIRVAAEALHPRGVAWFVANQHLPYEAELKQGFKTVRTVAVETGFKVVEAVKA